jgi:uncharacterized damage-inducible protein DinB
MSEVDRILDELRRTYHGKAWHGPPVQNVLSSISAAQAFERPLPAAHSIWELVLHMTTWRNCVRRSLEGEHVRVRAEVDWPPVLHNSESAWRAVLEASDREHESLMRCVRHLREDELDRPPRRRGQSAYRLLHGIMLHDTYHTGQMQILKKALKIMHPGR